jgi:nitroreductase
MKKNYAAWEINPQEFFECVTDEERIRFLLRFALLAPSSHNSQPWQFRIESKKAFSINRDDSRALHYSDQKNRQLYISLGCAIQAVRIACDHYGLLVKISYTDTGAKMDIADLEKDDTKADSHVFEALHSRSVNRQPYESTVFPPSELVTNIQTMFPSLSIVLVSDQKQKEKIANIVLEGIDLAMSNPQFRKELAQYLIPTSSTQSVGMPGNTLGIPFFMSYIAPMLMKLININKAEEGKNKTLLYAHTPAFIIITSHVDNKVAWMEAGRAYMQFALSAHVAGFTTHPMAAPIEAGDCPKQLSAILKTGDHPLFLLRVGKSLSMKSLHSPRLSLEKVMDPIEV